MILNSPSRRFVRLTNLRTFEQKQLGTLLWTSPLYKSLKLAKQENISLSIFAVGVKRTVTLSPMDINRKSTKIFISLRHIQFKLFHT